MKSADVRRAWGNDEQFYKELENFHEAHEKAQYIEYDNETALPIRACYVFWPLYVAKERKQLLEAIAEACKEEPKDNTHE